MGTTRIWPATSAAHLFKHAALGIDDIYDVWRSDPVFYPATPERRVVIDGIEIERPRHTITVLQTRT